MLALASLTAPLVNFATHAIGTLGLAGVALLMASSGIIGLPGTEPTMLFAGFDVYNGTLSLAGVIIAGVVGDVLGACIAYAIAYFGRQELIDRHGNKLHISHRRLDRAHDWFGRYGEPVMFCSRLIPFARLAFPYVAGVSEMPFRRFLLWTTLGSIVWVVGLAVLGREVGANWQTWRHHLEYVDYVGAALVAAGIVYLIVRRRRSDEPDEPVDADPAVDAVPR